MSGIACVQIGCICIHYKQQRGQAEDKLDDIKFKVLSAEE